LPSPRLRPATGSCSSSWSCRVSASRPSIPKGRSSPPSPAAAGGRAPCPSSRSAATSGSPSARRWRRRSCSPSVSRAACCSPCPVSPWLSGYSCSHHSSARSRPIADGSSRARSLTAWAPCCSCSA
jgi:hypothetical protein